MTAHFHHHSATPDDARRPILPFIGLLTVGSVPFWVAGAVAEDPSLGLPVALPVSALMVVCPLGAAAALTYREEGAAGVRRLLHRTVDLDKIRPWTRYIPIAGLLPAVVVMSYVVQGAMGRPVPRPEFPVGAVVGFTVLYLVSTACEQLGWTGYATDAMLERHDALTTALKLGAIWAAWHVIPYLQAGRSTSWIVWQCVFTVALRVVLTSRISPRTAASPRPSSCRPPPTLAGASSPSSDPTTTRWSPARSWPPSPPPSRWRWAAGRWRHRRRRLRGPARPLPGAADL